MGKFISFCFTLVLVFSLGDLFAQGKLRNDTTYISLQKIQNDSVRNAEIEKYLLKSLVDYKGKTDLVLKRSLYQELQRLYAERGDYKQAYLYADSAALVNTLIIRKDKVSKKVSLHKRYKPRLGNAGVDRHAYLRLRDQRLINHIRKLQIIKLKREIKRLNFAHKQTELESARQLQALQIQNRALQNKLDKQFSDQQIFEQNEKVKNDSRFQIFLIVLTIATLIIASLILYMQLKMRKLNNMILLQKNDIEGLKSVKDRMFNVIRHDMRTPVNNLMKFNTLLNDDNLSAVKIKNYTDELKRVVNHTALLMENLLNWGNSQMQGYNPQPGVYSLKEICEASVDYVKEQAKQKQITIINKIADNTAVYADKAMTELMVRNILTNAIKYTSRGGLVELNVSETDTNITFYITDNGVGMDLQQVRQFNSDSFDYTVITKPGTEKEKGSGLGLLLCKTLAHLMNGKISAKNDQGRGTTFYITLPKA